MGPNTRRYYLHVVPFCGSRDIDGDPRTFLLTGSSVSLWRPCDFRSRRLA